MSDSMLGATFLPSLTPEELLRRKQAMQSGNALRVLAMTLPGALGPNAIAPDLLLNSQGAAGQPASAGAVPSSSMPGGSPFATAMAQAIVQQVLAGAGSGAGGGSPLASLVSQIAPQSGVQASVGASPQSLSTSNSFSNIVRQEASNPTAQIAAPSATPAPSVSGASGGGGSTGETAPPRVLADQVQPGPSPEPPTETPQVSISDLITALRAPSQARMTMDPRQRFAL